MLNEAESAELATDSLLICGMCDMHIQLMLISDMCVMSIIVPYRWCLLLASVKNCYKKSTRNCFCCSGLMSISGVGSTRTNFLTEFN